MKKEKSQQMLQKKKQTENTMNNCIPTNLTT